MSEEPAQVVTTDDLKAPFPWFGLTTRISMVV